MSQQTDQLLNIAKQLEGRDELNAGEKGMWEAVTTPKQIIQLLGTVEAELNEFRAQAQEKAA